MDDIKNLLCEIPSAECQKVLLITSQHGSDDGLVSSGTKLLDEPIICQFNIVIHDSDILIAKIPSL